MDQEGRYQIVRELGRGGMGIVYLARDTRLKREVAIKCMVRSPGIEPQAWQDAVQRLMREAQAAAGLDHPNIVTIYDVDPGQDAPFIVMEFVRGKTLAEVTRPAAPMLPTLALPVLKQCASALDHAHSKGIIHNDIKPSNIMLDEAGSVRIADFGIAKLLDATTDLTRGADLPAPLAWPTCRRASAPGARRRRRARRGGELGTAAGAESQRFAAHVALAKWRRVRALGARGAVAGAALGSGAGSPQRTAGCAI